MKIGINKETIGSSIAVVLVAVGGWYAFTSGHQLGKGGPAAVGAADTIATVNGQKILRSELTATEAQLATQQGASATTTEAQAALQQQALDSIIGRTLLLQAAMQAGLTASTTAVDAQFAADKQQSGGEDGFAKALVAQGLTEDSLKTRIGEGLVVDAYLNQELNLPSLTVSDAEIKTAYNQVSASQPNVPPLAQVHDQVKQLVLGQKQQQLIMAQIAKLRAAGNVQILI